MNNTNTTITTVEAIKALDRLSDTLSQIANSEENFNTEMAYYIEQISFDMYRHANDLREMNYMLGGL